MIDKVRRTIEEHELFHKGDRVVIGVSGGADSVSLLHCLKVGLPELSLQVSVCHINHLLRGAESDRDERFVAALCSRLDVPFHLLRVDVAARAEESGRGIEECGRECRYRYYREVASSYGDGTKIATAHTADDQAETVLFRLARGTGLRGLSGIPVRRGEIVRPLIEVSREEVERYCSDNDLPYMEDSTNTDPAYARNRIRLQAIPALRAINPSFSGTLRTTLESLREDDEYLWKEAVRKLGQADAEDGYLISQIVSQHPAVQGRMIRLILRENGLRSGRDDVRNLLELSRKGEGARISVGKGTTAQISGGMICLFRPCGSAVFEPFPLREGLLTFPSNVAYNIDILSITEETKNVNRNFATDLIDCDRIIGDLTVRPRLPGDRISLWRRGVTKTLKKLFNEERIPPERRGLTAVLADEAGPVWVEGCGIDRRVAPDGKTRRCIQIRKYEGEDR